MFSLSPSKSVTKSMLKANSSLFETNSAKVLDIVNFEKQDSTIDNLSTYRKDDSLDNYNFLTIKGEEQSSPFRPPYLKIN